MALLRKKLAKAQPGVKVEIVYGEDQQLVGTVVDNDGTEEIEILSDDGKDLIIQYGAIKAYGELQSEASIPASSPEPSADRPARTQPVPVQTAFFMDMPESIMPSDQELYAIFQSLPKKEKVQITGRFDSFRTNIRANDMGKCRQAAERMRKDLQNVPDDWKQSRKLCGLMLVRCGQWESELLRQGGALWEAAFAEYKQDNFVRSGALAAAALLSGTQPEQEDRLFTLLLLACEKTDDVSAVCWLNAHRPQVSARHLDALMEVLLARKEVSAQVADPQRRLTALYPQTGMAELAQTFYQPATEQPDQSQEDDVWYGEITETNQLMERGVISCEEKQYPFLYSDVKDKELAARLPSFGHSDSLPDFLPVQFVLRPDGKPVQIQSDAEFAGQSLLEYARDLVQEAPKDYNLRKQAEPYLIRALQTPDAPQALVDLLAGSIVIFERTGDKQPMQQAEALYRAHESQFPIRWAIAAIRLATVYGYLGDFRKARTLLEPLIKSQDISPRNMINNYYALIRLYIEQYQVENKPEVLQDAVKACKAWEQLYRKTDELHTDSRITGIYVGNILSRLAFCEAKLGMLDEAEDHISRILCDYPEHQQASALRREIREKREQMAREQAQGLPDVQDEAAHPARPEAEGPGAEDDGLDEQWDVPQAYTDEDGWSALGMDKRTCIDCALAFSGEDRFAAMLAYLKAATNLNPEIEPVYTAVNLALDGPIDETDYAPDALLTLLDKYDRDYIPLHNFCLAAATLRSAFSSRANYTYTLGMLHDSVALFRQIPALDAVYQTTADFHQKVDEPVDAFSPYRLVHAKTLAGWMEKLIHQAKDLYQQHIETPPRDNVGLARLLETKKLIFSRSGTLAHMLTAIIARDGAAMEQARESFVQTWILPGKKVGATNINPAAVERMIDDNWKEAGNALTMQQQNSKLVSSRRGNLRSNIQSIVRIAAEWYDLVDQGAHVQEEKSDGAQAYAALQPRLRAQLEELCHVLTQMPATSTQEHAGLALLGQAARDLDARLAGTWEPRQKKYFFAGFLRSDAVLLDQDFLPDLRATFCGLPKFHILARICTYARQVHKPFESRFDELYGQDSRHNNYGTADLLAHYLTDVGQGEAVRIPDWAEKCREQTAHKARVEFRKFQENYALASSRGQIMLSDVFLTTLEDTMHYWYSQCCQTGDYGFFFCLVEQVYDKIHSAAERYSAQLRQQLDSLCEKNPALFVENNAETEIRAQIEQQNFTVAEDWMNLVQRGEYQMKPAVSEVSAYLRDFWDEYGENFAMVSNAGVALKNVQTRSSHRKDIRGGHALINSWIKGKGCRGETIAALLLQLGFYGLKVEERHDPHIVEDHYWVKAETVAGRRNFPHPIADFGSEIAQKGMMVVCLYGSYNTEGLLAKFRELDAARGNKIVLLDFALTEPDRRKLARKIKEKESGLFHTYLLIDRVVIQFLARRYNAATVNSMLMAVGMPFSYYQPYVADSTSAMPPEMFIGRKEELREIESAQGVNLIYGGRQLGKSALFKKARIDLDGNAGCRAVLVDLVGLDYGRAAEKLSGELIDLEILSPGSKTDSWATLAESIKRRLRAQGQAPIDYLLIMLDEADAFIESCKEVGYQPIAELKDIQQSLPGRFKFVLAGLHNIVRFNRSVALGNNAVITHLASLNVRPFDAAVAAELLTGPLAYLGFVLEDRVLISQILATTNYFPGLIQLYCKKMVESMRAPDYAGYNQTTTPAYIITDAHIKKVLSDSNFIHEIHDKFESTLLLDKDQGNYYYLLALLMGWMDTKNPSAAGYHADELLKEAEGWGLRPLTRLRTEQIEALLYELKDLNILRETAGGTFLFATKNFRDLLGTAAELEEKLLIEGVKET